MRVLEVGLDGLAVCADETGNGTDVMTDLVGDVTEGDTLLVHAGTALARILESEANVRSKVEDS